MTQELHFQWQINGNIVMLIRLNRTQLKIIVESGRI